jgi:hypothetical protein
VGRSSTGRRVCRTHEVASCTRIEETTDRRAGLIGAAAGLALGVTAVAAVEHGAERADAQASKVRATPAQLVIIGRIQVAAVKRSNRALNCLAPIRTLETDALDNGTSGVRRLATIPGAGAGWTSSQIAENAIQRVNIAVDAVDADRIAAGAVGESEIASGAVTSTKLSQGLQNARTRG